MSQLHSNNGEIRDMGQKAEYETTSANAGLCTVFARVKRDSAGRKQGPVSNGLQSMVTKKESDHERGDSAMHLMVAGIQSLSLLVSMPFCVHDSASKQLRPLTTHKRFCAFVGIDEKQL